MHQSELDADDAADEDAAETRKRMEIVLDLLYEEFKRIS
jgi:hypothetical protein